MSANTGYVTDNAGPVVYTLPTAATNYGDTVIVVGGSSGTGGWQIKQNALQTIEFGAAPTTTGTGGSLTSTNQYDSIILRCITNGTASSTWTASGAVGNLTVV
jgi:hypothetical protein